MLNRMLAISLKEWIQIRRDPRSLILSLIAPVFLLLLFGYALNMDVKDISIAVIDNDRSQLSRSLVDRTVSSDFFRLNAVVGSYAEADALMARGDISVYMVIPPSFEKDAKSRRDTDVQVVIDGSDSMTANIALGYLRVIFTGFTQDLLPGAGAARISMPVILKDRIWYNEELESRIFTLTGIVAIILAIISALVASLTISREIERGTFESLLSTPVRPKEIVIGKLIPYLMIGLFDVCIAYTAGHLIFDLPIKGSFFLLLSVSALFIAGTCGLGMMISVVTKVQVVSVQIALVATYLPSLVLSGFIFPVSNMPAVVQAITFIIPAKYLISMIKLVAIKGMGVGFLVTQILFLSIYSALVLVNTTRKIRAMLPYGGNR